MTDREFVQGIIRRDEAVFRELVGTYQQHVIRTCYSLVHDEQEARDLAQEVFIELLDSAGSFRGDAKLSTWIYRIAVNKSLNCLKKQKRRQILERIGLRSASPGRQKEEARNIPSEAGADSALEAEELKRVLHFAIGQLPASQRIAFTMHKYEELSYREIADVMNVSVPSVESLIHRAKMNLQRNLADYYQDKK
jgi:RNA polymerase sigma-70 factor (ECF subfamily)